MKLNDAERDEIQQAVKGMALSDWPISTEEIEQYAARVTWRLENSDNDLLMQGATDDTDENVLWPATTPACPRCGIKGEAREIHDIFAACLNAEDSGGADA